MAAQHSIKEYRQGSIKLFETLGVLIVFMILLGFAFIFYSFIQRSSFEHELAAFAEQRSQSIVEKALLLPELDCSLTGVIDINCVDLLKVTAFANAITSSKEAEAEYFAIFKNSRIVVKQIWPQSNATIIIYNRSPEIMTVQIVFSSPIIIHDPLYNKKMFGLMEVVTYG